MTSEYAETALLSREKAAYNVMKRGLDVALSALVLVVLAPFWLLIALLIKLTSKGPVLFRQTQEVGMNGRVFTLYKFRTMYSQTSEEVNKNYQKEYIRNNKPYKYVKDKAGNQLPVYKVIDDERVTPVGRIIRRTSLDEVPQFFNVLKGEMSIVGPRPATLYEYEQYQDWHKQRLTVLPGITGLHQISTRSSIGFENMVKTDLEYIARRSIWLDLKIMLLTPWVMLTGKGAH
jgi:lipopolysaccharide/colanic/teichoic acid biosynthesis glycosyltransferase